MEKIIVDGILSKIVSELTHLREELKELKLYYCKENQAEVPIKLREAAEIFKIAISTLRKHISEGKIPYYKAGRNIMLMRSDVQDWILSDNKMEDGNNQMGDILRRRR